MAVFRQTQEMRPQQDNRNNHVVLISTSEIILKSPYVRGALQKALLRDLLWKLMRDGEKEARISVEHGRIIIRNLRDPIKAADLCSSVFGVAVSCAGFELSARRDTLVKQASALASKVIMPKESFAVRARVVGAHEFTSRDIESEIGRSILNDLATHGVGVNLDKPDRTVFVEVRESHSYVYFTRNAGVGGLPYGTQGRLIAMVSGGIDSPVAAWLMMKRGAHVIPVFMDMTPFSGQNYKMKAVDVVKRLRDFAPVDPFRMLIVPFGEIAEAIAAIRESRLRCVLCKRMMYRISSIIANKERALGVVTGESVGQVASQTLRNLAVLDEAVSLPIYRPLIGMDKQEIQNLAKKIGTYNLSIQRAQGCSLVPGKPATSANIEKVNEAEAEFTAGNLAHAAAEKIDTITL